MFASQMFAQTTVQVVTKTLSGEEQWTPGMALEINGENAEIHCSGHTANTIVYEIQLVAKHPDKKIAEQDLKKLLWISGEQGKKFVMRNYIELTRDDQRPKSNLKAIYHIKVPSDCPLTINNYFGEISIENINGQLDINSEFAPIKLNNVNGTINIKSKFGDITSKAIGGHITIYSTRSNIDFTGINGTLEIEAEVSEIKFDDLGKIIALTIEAEKSEISISAGNHFRYLLDITNVDFERPVWMSPKTFNVEKDLIKVNLDSMPESPLISIKLNIGTLELK